MILNLGFVLLKIMIEFVENYLKPSGVILWIFFHVFTNFINVKPLPGFYFFGIDFWFSVVRTNHYMVEFVLGESVIKRCFIYRGEKLFQFCRKAHFFEHTPVSGFDVGFVYSLLRA